MGKIYRIGRHEFESREEWEKALKDVKRIKSIVDHLDVENPEDVLTIYNMIRDGEVRFLSELGAAFYYDISNRVADNSQHMLKEGFKQNWDGVVQIDEKKQKESRMFKMIGIICILLAVICFGVYTYYEYSEREAVRRLETLQEQKSISQAINWYFERLRTKREAEEAGTEWQDIQQEAVAETVEPVVLSEYASLQAIYPELVGWLRIDGTQMDLPVMQTTDNEYYLTRNIDGSEDKNGTLFLDYRADIHRPSTNLIVYGHNMRSGAMFGELKKYLDESFIAGHEWIQFDTMYEKRTYQLIAVCLSEVGYQDEPGTKYYDFIEAQSEEDLNAFLETVRGCAVYDKTQDVTLSDSLLTLSTCNSYVEDGRLFVVAKKIQ
ncbi:MAG: class B sortase [Lachnospiraceae bacterium]|nr:class B sortase [Lachnospiraceae bacterium]